MYGSSEPFIRDEFEKIEPVRSQHLDFSRLDIFKEADSEYTISVSPKVVGLFNVVFMRISINCAARAHRG